MWTEIGGGAGVGLDVGSAWEGPCKGGCGLRGGAKLVWDPGAPRFRGRGQCVAVARGPFGGRGP